MPDTGRYQGGDSTTLGPSPAEASRGPKRHIKNGEGSRSFKVLHRTTSRPTWPGLPALDKLNGNIVIQGRGHMRIQDQALRSDVTSGKSGPWRARNVGAVP